MEITKPQYYDAFHCLAGSCPDSCCKEWAVQVDDTAADFYRGLPGDLGDALRSVLVQEDGETILALTSDGRCPMWRSDGLCRIQAQLGEAALCHTCRQFPRLRHDYGDLVELGLELSCPEAARLILAAPPAPLLSDNQVGGQAGDYDGDAMAILRRTREILLEYLAHTDAPAGQALAVTLLYGYAVQNELDGGEEAALDPAAYLAQARGLAASGNPAAFIDFFKTLEILTPAWRTRLETPKGSSWTEGHLAMARYFIHRYWLQAVSDYDLVGRAKLAVCSCLLVKLLGGDLLQTAQLYSKEIENDPDNIDAILDGAYDSPALTDIALLGMLLEV